MLAAARSAALLLAAIALPAHAGSCIWYSHDDSIRQVDTESGEVTRIVPLRNPHRLVMNAEDCGVWTLDKHDRKVLRFGADGALERVIDVRQLHPALDEVEHLRLDRDGVLWVTDNRRIFRISTGGELLGQFAAPGEIRRVHVALDQTLWVLGTRHLWRFDATGMLLAAHSLEPHLAGNARYFEVDSVAGLIWIVDEDDLAQLQIANPAAPPLRIRLQRDITAFTLDPLTGNAWVAQHEQLLGFSRAGERIATVNLQALGIRKPGKLGFDPSSKSLWVGAERSVSRFTDAGLLVARFSARDGDEALGVPAFSVKPVLTLLLPPQNALTNNPRPEIRLRYSADCNGQTCPFAEAHFAGYQLTAMLNGQAIGTAFQLDLAAREAFHIPAARLPEGANQLSAQVTDPFGRKSNLVTASFTLDSIPPLFLTLSPADGALFQAPQAMIEGTVDDPLAAVILENSGATRSGGSFSFPVVLQPGPNLFTLSAIDPAGNRTVAQRTLNLMPLALSITSPVAGAAISGSSVLVSGTVQGAANLGVTVNGVIATFAAGTFHAMVPLQPGSNVVTVIARTADGIGTERTIAVTSTPAAVEISASPQGALAPANVSFQLSGSGLANVLSVLADFSNDGSFEFGTQNVGAPIPATYAQPGVHTARFLVNNRDGTSFTLLVPIVVQDRATVDQQLRSTWAGLVGALGGRDVPRAAQYLTGNARETYVPMLQALGDRLPAIVASWSEPRTFTLTEELGEYAIRRVESNGKPYLYLIYFQLGEDGVWRVGSM